MEIYQEEHLLTGINATKHVFVIIYFKIQIIILAQLSDKNVKCQVSTNPYFYPGRRNPYKLQINYYYDHAQKKCVHFYTENYNESDQTAFKNIFRSAVECKSFCGAGIIFLI